MNSTALVALSVCLASCAFIAPAQSAGTSPGANQSKRDSVSEVQTTPASGAVSISQQSKTSQAETAAKDLLLKRNAGVADIPEETVQSELALLKRIQNLETKGVGIKTLKSELAQIDALYRRDSFIEARMRFDKLEQSVAHHEKYLADKAAAEISNTQTASMPPASIGAAPVADKTPEVSLAPIKAGPDNVPEPGLRWSRSEYERFAALEKFARFLKAKVHPTREQGMQIYEGLVRGDHRYDALVSAALTKNFGALAPAPGPLWFERFVVAQKLDKMVKRPGHSVKPEKLQEALAAYRELEKTAANMSDKSPDVKTLTQSLATLESSLGVKAMVNLSINPSVQR